MRLIDANALEELFREVIGGIAKKPEMNGNLEHMVRASAMVIEMIQDAPTIEPERKTGHWIDKTDPEWDGEWDDWQCSCCGSLITSMARNLNGVYLYCPKCGARMEDNDESD